jgi:lantibiotic biosynthesis protein
MSGLASEFAVAADRIGRRLCRDAIWAGDRCNWLGWSMEPLDGAWAEVCRSMVADLYGGTSGIALFLAHLYKVTGDRLQRETMIGAVNHAVGQLTKMTGPERIGYFSGGTGIATALIEIGELVGEESLVVRGVKELRSIARESPSDVAIDVVSGSAGAIPVLLRTWRRFDCNELFDSAHKHGKFLIEQANHTEEGWSWRTIQGVEQRDLTGYSHGVAGIVLALLELWKVTSDAEFLEGAREGLRYERRYFDRAQQNWPDFRSFQQPAGAPSFALAWCHGAPGIGLSRLRAYELLDKDAQILDEIDAALNTTMASLAQPLVDGQGNFSLCHGLCGNVELPLVASQVLARPELRRAAENVAQLGIEYFSKRDMPWPCGTTYGKETPNLMLGLAGIGYFYLRMRDTQSVPSILLQTANDSSGT